MGSQNNDTSSDEDVAMVKVVTGAGGYVLQGVPHLTDYISDLPVCIFLSFLPMFIFFLFFIVFDNLYLFAKVKDYENVCF